VEEVPVIDSGDVSDSWLPIPQLLPEQLETRVPFMIVILPPEQCSEKNINVSRLFQTRFFSPGLRV
jgi:hypothetical protein